MRTLNTNHTDVLKEKNRKKRSKEKGTKSNISNNPHGIYIYFTKEDFEANAFCMKITFFGFALFFFSYGLYACMYERRTLEVFNKNYDDKDFQTTSIYIV